jgi:ribonuclease BN (tRNA processing enzyme)
MVSLTSWTPDRELSGARRPAYDNGIKALAVTNLQTLFITHLHSDHTVGYPDLIFTTWVQGRRRAIQAYGPPGFEAMTKYIMLAWQVDIDARSKGLEQRDPSGLAVEAHDLKPGLVYQDSNVKVTAFPVPHGDLQAFGYKFQTPDRTIVISGDQPQCGADQELPEMRRPHTRGLLGGF